MLDTDGDCCILLDREVTSVLLLAAVDSVVASEDASRESDEDLFESLLADTGAGLDEGTTDALLPKNDRRPPDLFSTSAGFASCFTSGSAIFHPAGISSFWTSTLLFTDSSHAARLLAVNKCDIGLCRTMGRFFDSFTLLTIALAECDRANWIGGWNEVPGRVFSTRFSLFEQKSR